MATSGQFNATMAMYPIVTLSRRKDGNAHELAVVFCAVRQITTIELVTWVQVKKKTIYVYKVVLGRVSCNSRPSPSNENAVIFRRVFGLDSAHPCFKHWLSEKKKCRV